MCKPYLGSQLQVLKNQILKTTKFSQVFNLSLLGKMVLHVQLRNNVSENVSQESSWKADTWKSEEMGA